MKKQRENPGSISVNSINLSRDVQKTYNIDQNFRKNQNSNIMDLVTHKQKQIQKKKYRLGAKQKHVSDSEDQLYSSNQNNYQFQEENGANPNNNRYRPKDVDKDKLLGVINRLVAKNKINSKIAFDIPILSVDDFAMYDDGVRGDIAWNKMSSILENDYKIYGVRVDSIVQYVKKMSDSLGRKDAHDTQTKQKQKQVKQLKEAKDTKQQKQRQKTIKLSQLMSNKQNLTAYLQKNSESLDINLRTKLMMRKDPIFQRTSRIFDYSSYSSFFMNTLSLRKGLFMQINANSQEEAATQMQEEKQQINQSGSGQKLNVDENPQKYNILIEQTLKIKPEFQVRKSIEKFSQNLEQFGVTLFPEDLKEEQSNINYLKIINMVMSGHLTTAFQVGVSYQYDSSSQKQEYQQEDNIINQIKPNKVIQIYDQECDKMHLEQDGEQEKENEVEQLPNMQIQQESKGQKQEKNEAIVDNQSPQVEEEREMILSEQKKQVDLDPVILNSDMDQEKQENQQMLDKKNKQQLKQKINKKTRKIKQVINIKKSEQKINGTRNKGLSKQIRSIIKGQKRSNIPKVLKQKELFDPQVKQNFKRVIKKEKILHIETSNIFDTYQERNLIKLLRQYEFQLKNPLQLRPTATKEELKKEKQKVKLAQYERSALAQEQIKTSNIVDENKSQIVEKTDAIVKTNTTEPINNVAAKNEQISESEDEQLKQKRQINNHRNQTITNVKQNIYSIIKIQQSTDFQSLVKEYTKKYANLSPATIFIAMLHLSNERFIKTIQFGKKNFKVTLSDL